MFLALFAFLYRFCNYPEGSLLSLNEATSILTKEHLVIGDLTTCGGHSNYECKLKYAQQVVKYCREISQKCGKSRFQVNANPFQNQAISTVVIQGEVTPATNLKEGKIVRFCSDSELRYGTIKEIMDGHVKIEAEDDKGVLIQKGVEEVFSVYLKGKIYKF